jgi:hypothetical protein
MKKYFLKQWSFISSIYMHATVIKIFRKSSFYKCGSYFTKLLAVFHIQDLKSSLFQLKSPYLKNPLKLYFQMLSIKVVLFFPKDIHGMMSVEASLLL